MERLETAEEEWGGGYHELGIQLGPRSDERLLAALKALWAHPTLDGPFVNVVAAGTPRVAHRTTWEALLAETEYGLSTHLWGMATLHDGERAPCGSMVFRGEGPIAETDEEDQLLFSLPNNGLPAAWAEVGDFPFTDDTEGVRRWQEPLEEWLADLGRAVFDKAPFPIALIGFEATSIDFDVWSKWLEEVPEERSFGVLRREHDAVGWYPTTIWGGPIGARWEDLVDVTPWRIRLRNRLQALLKRRG